jgi:hypothetical protein
MSPPEGFLFLLLLLKLATVFRKFGAGQAAVFAYMLCAANTRGNLPGA